MFPTSPPHLRSVVIEYPLPSPWRVAALSTQLQHFRWPPASSLSPLARAHRSPKFRVVSQGDDEGTFENLGFDQGAFEALEADFENVLQELGSDPQLERFRLEYETLYRALKKSHESEKRLVKKCKELTMDIATTVKKTEAAVRLSAEDQQQIVGLKQEILRTSTAVESSLLKEKETKEEVRRFSRAPQQPLLSSRCSAAAA